MQGSDIPHGTARGTDAMRDAFYASARRRGAFGGSSSKPLFVAIDHGKSELFTADDGTDIRQVVCATVAASGRWGLVLSSPLPSVSGVDTCIGLPDIHRANEILSLEVPNVACGSVRVGFDHVGRDCVWAMETILEKVRRFGRTYLEPYCLSPACLVGLTRLAASLPERDVVLKLAVDDQSLAVLAAAGLRDQPLRWVARSDGMAWDVFIEQLAKARTLGCDGVMAGRAVWGELRNIPAEDRGPVLKRRLGEVARSFDGPVTSAGGASERSHN